MPINVSQIKWGSYGGFEGPVFYGVKPFKSPENPTFLEKCMAVISQCEGHIDSVNMYDSGIVSVGTVQWIERGANSVSDMIGKVAEKCGVEYVNSVLASAMTLSNAVFKKNAAGRWRFFMTNAESLIEVSTPASQQQCFLSCSGKKGEWTPTNIIHAKTWCAAIASLWDSDVAAVAQIDFSAERLLPWFVTSNAKRILFSDLAESGWKGALKAIYVSFAVNLPSVADRNLVIADKESTFPKWSREYCLDVIAQLVFGSKITIWPIRYSALVKTVNSLFGVDLPASARELSMKKWKDKSIPVVISTPASASVSITPPSIEIIPLPITVKIDSISSQAPTSNKNQKIVIACAIFATLTVFARFVESCVGN